MRLYDIDSSMLAVIDGGLVFDEETGEVLWDEESFAELEGERNAKLEACALYIKDLCADVDALKAEEKRLAERRKAAEKRAERLKRYVADSMCLFGDKKLETTRACMTLRHSEAVEVDEDMVAFLPREFVTAKVSLNPNKAALRKALKDGEEVDGARIVSRTSLVVK